ncbi:hypothetical protein QA540_08790 [Macrococcus psychrotolerans]|uniref:Uncharacterized protein n=1 Tax=Macrococcus psychrotolerans TaxID=3039389 RepID=A0AAU6RFA6_9STAP|nr:MULTISPECIES: hypothetical protein [Macrococcus]QYA32493.1 hypothetical protein KYI10_09080 [Macrococcus sp. 19Msa1099]QYA37302.1 hypothetical protein KYI07_09070 [Macrococcus caseolyticus]QYA76009.1 hypothetical protein KYI12_09070 [Macrococcus caseolyticus]
MKFKFAIIGITALLIVMYVMHVIESGFDILPLLGIIAVAVFLFWVDHKLERPVTKQSIKKSIKETTKK